MRLVLDVNVWISGLLWGGSPRQIDVPELRDPDDAVIIGTAIAAKARIIVSGDLDLLVLKEFANIPILTPTNFLNQNS